jgi:Restriction endonuclease
MSTRSHYDELHDRYHAILTTKAGTRYERLAALVFKTLAERNVVIHDLKLLGDSTIAHQIDVSIDADSKRRRVLIECKDFDVSGEKVGLDVLRSFRSVLEDTKVHEGIVITCVGFTRDAKLYAKSKGIKLAVLRKIEDRDLEGFIQSVNVQLHIQSNRDHATTIHMPQQSHDQFVAECARLGIAGRSISLLDPVFVVTAESRLQFTAFLNQEVDTKRAARVEGNRWEVKSPADGAVLQVGDNGVRIPFDMIVTSYRSDIKTIHMNIHPIAELIVSGLGDDDIYIYDEHIKRRKIDATTGEIL